MVVVGNDSCGDRHRNRANVILALHKESEIADEGDFGLNTSTSF